MGLMRLAIRRLFAQRALAATMVATFAFTGGVLVAAPIYAAGAEQAIVFGDVEKAPPLSRDLIATFTTPPGYDIGAADTTVRGLLTSMPISSVAFQERSSVLTAGSDMGTMRASVLYREGLVSAVGLTDGRYPTGPDEVLLPQAVASVLSLRPGETIQLAYSTSVTVRVAGIYASIPDAAPLIVGETSAAAKATALPIITTETGFSEVVAAAGQSSGIHIAWAVEPDVRGRTVAGLILLADEEDRTANAVSAASGASVSSNLSTLVPLVRRAVAASRAPIYLVVLQVAMVGLGVAIGVGSLKLRRQSFELSILKTRGARASYLVLMQVTELFLTAVLGWGLALGLGLLLATAARAAHGPGAPGAPFGLTIDPTAVWIGLAGIGTAAIVLLLLALPHLRRSVLAERREVSRERRPLWLRLPAEVLPLALGFVALVELRRRGIRPSGDRLDPLVLVAPTVLMLGASLLSVRLFFLGARRIERSADRAGSPSIFLATHRLSRSSANMSLMLLLVLSTALFAFSSSLRTTVLDHNTIAARGEVGADLRYLVPLPSGGVRAAGGLPEATTFLFKGPVITAGDPRLAFSTVVGVDPGTYERGGWWPAENAGEPLPELLGRLDAQPIGYRIPAGATTLEIEVTASSPAPVGVDIVAPIALADGTVRDVDLGPLAPGRQTYEAPTDGAERLLSVMLTAPSIAAASLVHAGSFAVTFERLSILGTDPTTAVPISDWQGLQATRLVVRAAPTPSGGLRAEFQLAGGGPIGGIAPVNPALPALLPAAGAAGDQPIAIHLGFAGFSVRSVGVVRAFPTVTRGSVPIVVPIEPLIERFDQILQPPNGGVFEVLGMGTADPSAAIRRAGFPIGVVARAADIEADLATSPQNLALGMEFAAGVAGSVLAVLALGSALFFGAQRRRYELASLRALGGRASHAMAALALEYGLILVPALIVGAVLGTLLLRLVLTAVSPPVQGTGPAVLVIDGAGVMLAAAAATLTLAFGLVSAGRQMRTRESTSALRGEPE